MNLDAGLATGFRLGPCEFFYFISGIQMLTYFLHNNNNNNNNNHNNNNNNSNNFSLILRQNI